MLKFKTYGKLEKAKLKRDENSLLFGEDNLTNNLTRKLKKIEQYKGQWNF